METSKADRMSENPHSPLFVVLLSTYTSPNLELLALKKVSLLDKCHCMVDRSVLQRLVVKKKHFIAGFLTNCSKTKLIISADTTINTK